MNASTQTVPTEQQEQRALAQYLDGFGLLWCHVPNETRAPVHYLRRRAQLGVKPGVPDVFIFDRPKVGSWIGVAIELKRQRGGRLTRTQRYWIKGLGLRHWFVARCDGANAAIALVRQLYG